MAASSGNAFDFKLFKRLLAYTSAYKGTFYFVAIAAILLSLLGVMRPLLAANYHR
jgi:ATP-binding cassette, subfamily B, multidrug efflux pump